MDPLEVWAFVPHSRPGIAEGERPVVRLACATHYIERQLRSPPRLWATGVPSAGAGLGAGK
jgi:hypothetical protein